MPHDRLFLDALERDHKREKMGLEPTTVVVGDPTLSFTYDPKRSLYEQFSKPSSDSDGESDDPSRNESGTGKLDGESVNCSGWTATWCACASRMSTASEGTSLG